MRSLKSRLIYGMIGGMLLLFLAFDIIIYNSITSSITRQFDDSLKSSADLVCAAVEWSPEELEFEIDTSRMANSEGVSEFIYYEVRSAEGTIIQRSSLFEIDEFTAIYPNKRACEFKTVVLKNKTAIRAIAVNFVPRTDFDASSVPSFILTLAKRYDGVLSQLYLLKKLFLAASAIIIIFSCAIAVIIINRSLAPLASVAAQIESINQENLSKRVAGDRLPSELTLIQNKINELLTRLQFSFEREKAFNSNVAHELRNPLAAMRMIIEVALSKTRDACEFQTAMEELVPIIDNMQTLSQKLLMLTKIESGKIAVKPVLLQARPLIDNCWSSFNGRAAESKIVFENALGKDDIFHSDNACVSIIVSNLLDNAVSHTNKGGQIRVMSQKTNGELEITFENTGNKINEQQIDKIFDYYWRGDESRNCSDNHFGLGLPLVKRIIGLLNGKIRVKTANDLFSVTVSIPCELKSCSA